MASIDRTTIIRGPAKITYDSATFYSKGGITLTFTNSTFDKETDGFGIVNRAKTDLQLVVEFEPVGEIEELAKLFPYASTAIGASIYSTTDKPLVIIAQGNTYTINNARITSLPSIRCTANNTAFGSIQFTGLIDNSGNPNTLSDYYSVTTSGTFADTAFDPTKLITAPYTATLGGSTTFYSEAGFEIAFDLSLTPVTVDGIGTVDMTLANLGATITCIPIDAAYNAFDTYFGSLDAGEDLASATLDISTTTTGGLNVDFAGVQITDFQRRFSPNDNRNGTLTMVAKRTFTSGAPNALFTVAAV
jgi:hypothetical protein